MAPKDPSKPIPNKDDKAPARGEGVAARAAQPGAVAVSATQAARLDERIDEKTRTSHAASVRPGAVAESDDSKVAAKVKGESAALAQLGVLHELRSAESAIQTKMDNDLSAATQPGAFHQLQSVESAVRTKLQENPSPHSRMEADVQAKQTARSHGLAVRPGASTVSPPGSNTDTQRVVAERLDTKIDDKVRRGAPAARGGVDTSLHHKMEAHNGVMAADADAQAKLRARGASTAAAASGPAGSYHELRAMEDSIQGKLHSNLPTSAHCDAARDSKLAPGEAAAAAGMTPQGLRNFEADLRTKLHAGETTPDALTNLQESVLKKEKMIGGAAAALHNADKESVPVDLYDSQDVALHKSRPNNATGDPAEPGKTDKDMESRMYSDLDVGSGLTSDLEYGEYGGPEDKGLAVAFAVEEEDDVYIPSAVEFDPDSKPPMLRNRRFRLYATLAVVVTLVGIVGAVAGMFLSQTSSVPALPDRDTLGIREYVERFIGSEPLNDPTSPYRKALDWIQHVDPMALTPESKQFMQRFLAAYFYYATSVQKEWSNGCEPSTEEATNNCILDRVGVRDVSIKYRIDGKRWLSSDDECIWGGVTCDEFNQIRLLDFTTSNMTGSFPEGLSHLPYLQFVSLSHAEISGPLPAVVGEMKHLVNLELVGNQISGPIPDNWYHSRHAQKINLGYNRLTGTLSKEVSRWKNMRGWFVHGNKLTGSVPSEYGSMINLSFLWVGENQLTGTLPSTLGQLAVVRELVFHRNQFKGQLPTELGSIGLLFDLRLNVNQLTGTIPTEFAQLSGLESLLISNNNLTGSIAPLTNLTEIVNVRIEENTFSGTLPPELSQLRSMTTFVASGNNFEGIVPTKLCNLVLKDTVRGSQKVLTALEMDCAVDVDGVPEIECLCCTSCCDSDGTNCVPVL